MANIIRIDDTVIRSLISTQSLWKDFPKFEKYHQKYMRLPKKSGCNCRSQGNEAAPIFNEVKNYIRILSREQKQKLKLFLKADYIKINIVEPTGRHKDITF